MNLELLHAKYLESKDAYYNGESDISDDEFDMMEQQLLKAGIIFEVGAVVPEGRLKYTHPTKMLSLDKYQILGESDDDDLQTLSDCWDKYCGKTGVPSGILSYKYDGIAINLIYKFGKLSKVATRGDGFEGMDVTEKFADIFPQKINTTDYEFVEVRCEAYMTYSDFEQYDVKNGGKYKHVRNLVGGIFNDINPNDPRKQHISYATLEIINSDTGEIIPIDEWIYTSNELFNNMKESIRVLDLSTFLHGATEMIEQRSELGFPTDGMVLSMNVDKHDHNGKYPNHAVSIKFIPPSLKSTIKGFSWVLHKTGRYVPKIHIEPITVDGRDIVQMSGHNMEYLILHDLNVGDEIEVILSNDIIPMVGKNHGGGEQFPYWSTPNDKTYHILGDAYDHTYLKSRFKIPSDGYVDGCDLLIEGGSDNQQIKKLKYYYFLEQFEIDGISRKTHEKLGDIPELFNEPTFIFTDNFTIQLLINNGFGIKTSTKIVNGYKSFKSKGIHIINVIRTLAISGSGTTITEQYARLLSGVDYDLSSLNSKVLLELDSRLPELEILINKLGDLGVSVNYYKDEVKTVSVDQKLVILTGSPKGFGFDTKQVFLDTYPNLKETKKFTEAEYLVTDDINSKSSKMSKATKQGLNIRTYGDF